MKKGWTLAFCLLMTAVCLFMIWSVADRAAIQARYDKAVADRNYFRDDRIPLQRKQLAREEQSISPARERVEAVKPLVEAAQKEQREAAAAAKAYTQGFSKKSQATRAYKTRVADALDRLTRARETYARLTEQAGWTTEATDPAAQDTPEAVVTVEEEGEQP